MIASINWSSMAMTLVPRAAEGEIVVCARKDESERYRIPETLRDNPNAAQNQAWSERVRAYEYVGSKTGTQSCSPSRRRRFYRLYSAPVDVKPMPKSADRMTRSIGAG